MSKVVVLNSDMSVLGTTDWKTAICMIERDRAESILDSEIRVHIKYLKPLIIRIINTVRHLWKKAVPFSKDNVHCRDNHTCQYCGTTLKRAKCTVDHVVPRDQGGKNSWTNLVTACFACNNYKSNRTPNQANMFLKRQPVQPTIMQFILQKVKNEGIDSLVQDLLGYKT